MVERESWLNKFGRVAVLYGGTSAERAISLQSGDAVIRALREEGVEVVPIDVGEDVVTSVAEVKADRAFIALHGPGGEDGKIQSLLEFLNIPYTGSGVCASALSMDKVRSKQLWQGVSLPTPGYLLLTEKTDWQKAMDQLGEKAIVKPCHEGSSIGMTTVVNAGQLENAFRLANRYDRTVLAETFVDGAEYTVAVLGGQTLPPVRLETDHQFYDYEAKYQANDTRYLCPCGLSEEKVQELQSLALAAFNAIGAVGWGRIDVMADRAGNFYLLELNSVPGMTDHSLVPMAAKAAGYTFNDLVLTILRQTLDEHSVQTT